MCTGIRFDDGLGHMYFGRNLDWSCGYGERVTITPTGWKPNSPFGAIGAMEHPVYGMGIVCEGTPLYFDCANDAGLAVAGLNFPGYAEYAPEGMNPWIYSMSYNGGFLSVDCAITIAVMIVLFTTLRGTTKKA